MRAVTRCLCALPYYSILSPNYNTLTRVRSHITATIPSDDCYHAKPQPTPILHTTSPLAQSNTTNYCSTNPPILLPPFIQPHSQPYSMPYKCYLSSSAQMRLYPSPPLAMKRPCLLQEMELIGQESASYAKVIGLGYRLRNSGRVLRMVAMESTWSTLLAWQTFSTCALISLRFLGKRLRRKGQTCGLNLTAVCISSMILAYVLVWWLIGTRVALRILPPSDPTMKIFRLSGDWPMLSPLTGITTFSFFRSIRNPFIGNFIRFLLFPYSVRAALGTSHSKILPSEPRDSRL